MKLMIVGGEATVFAKTAWIGHILDAGNEILAHHDSLSRVGNIPSRTQVVLLIVDACSDRNTHGLNALCANANVDLIRVSRRWALAEPVLRAAGVLPANESRGQPHKAHKKNLAVDYISAQRRLGREPSSGEILSILRANLGPQTKASRKEMGRWLNLARNVPVTATVKCDLVQQAARAVLEERPHFVLPIHQDSLLGLVKELAAPAKPHIWPENLRDVIAEEAVSFRAQWSSMKARQGASASWVRALFREFLDGGAYPGSSRIKGEGKALFGKHLHNDTVRAARADVLGAWALDIKPQNQLEGYFETRNSTGPTRRERGPAFRLADLIESGEIKGFKAARRWWTSTVAIDQWDVDQQEARHAAETLAVAEAVRSRPFTLPTHSTPDVELDALLIEMDAAKDDDIEAAELAFSELETIDASVEDEDMPSVLLEDEGGLGAQLDMNSALSEALGEVIEDKLLDLSAAMADLVAQEVCTKQSADFDRLASDLAQTLKTVMAPFTRTLMGRLDATRSPDRSDLADVINRHSAKVALKMAESARQVSNSTQDIRTWLANVSRTFKELSPDNLNPEFLMSSVEGRLKGIEVGLNALLTRPAPKATASTPTEVSVGVKDIISQGHQVLVEEMLALTGRVEELLAIAQAPAPAAVQRGGSLADLIKLAASQGLKVSFEPL